MDICIYSVTFMTDFSAQLQSLLVHGSIPTVDWLDPLTARAIEAVKQVSTCKFSFHFCPPSVRVCIHFSHHANLLAYRKKNNQMHPIFLWSYPNLMSLSSSVNPSRRGLHSSALVLCLILKLCSHRKIWCVVGRLNSEKWSILKINHGKGRRVLGY